MLGIPESETGGTSQVSEMEQSQQAQERSGRRPLLQIADEEQFVVPDMGQIQDFINEQPADDNYGNLLGNTMPGEMQMIDFYGQN